MDENINNLTKILFESHKKPIVKLNTGGVKSYLPKSDDSELINQNLNVLKETFSFPRVERRNVRSQGIFLQSKRLVMVVKLHNLQNFGFRDKTGMYLYLEEALYLLEINRLEILWNNVPISTQQGYNLFFDEILTLDKYRVYKKLLLNGFKVQRFKDISSEPTLKRVKLDEKELEEVPKEDVDLKGSEEYLEIFKKLKEKTPKELDVNLEENPVYLVNNFDKNGLKDKFNVHIVKQEMDPKIGLYKENPQNLFGVVSNDEISLYRISKVSLPNLINI